MRPAPSSRSLGGPDRGCRSGTDRVTLLVRLIGPDVRIVVVRGGAMVLLRKVIGDALRARRLAQHRTLREVSTGANVSLGYLSEIERGHKEASSELLASICEALGTPLSEVLGEVSATFALAEQMEEAFAATADLADEPVATRVPAEAGVTNSLVPAGVRAGDEP